MPRVSMAVIAAKAGVSKNTVSLALRDDPRVSGATRATIVAIARELGYERNPVMAQLMVELRRARPVRYRRTLALFNGHHDRRATARHHSIPVWVEGCRRRAERQGFRLDEFWLGDPELNGARLHRILATRAIRGAIVVGAFVENRLPERFAQVWEGLACVVAGVRTRGPTLSFCCVDHHAIVLEAVRRVRGLGYRRPGLVVDARVDRLVDGRFGSAMWLAQGALPAADRVEAFTRVDDSASGRGGFIEWCRERRPDAILTLHPGIVEWLHAEGIATPGEVGIALLERRADHPELAGMNQRNDLAGEAAVDLLMTMLDTGEAGVPAFPRATFVAGVWEDGPSLPPRRGGRSAACRSLEEHRLARAARQPAGLRGGSKPDQAPRRRARLRTRRGRLDPHGRAAPRRYGGLPPHPRVDQLPPRRRRADHAADDHRLARRLPHAGGAAGLRHRGDPPARARTHSHGIEPAPRGGRCGGGGARGGVSPGAPAPGLGRRLARMAPS